MTDRAKVANDSGRDDTRRLICPVWGGQAMERMPSSGLHISTPSTESRHTAAAANQIDACLMCVGHLYFFCAILRCTAILDADRRIFLCAVLPRNSAAFQRGDTFHVEMRLLDSVGNSLSENQNFLVIDDQQQTSASMRKLGEEARARMENGGGTIRYFEELLKDRYVPTKLLDDFR